MLVSCLMRYVRFVASAVLLQFACGAAPPISYEDDRTSWTLPLVDPEGTAELVVPVTLEGRGPYNFILDPDAACTVIDEGVAEELGLYSDNRWIRVLTQRDVTVPRRFFELLHFQSGDLRARSLTVLGVPAGSLSRDTQRIDGIMGADLLSRTIVVQADRDAGVVRLYLTGHAAIPVGAIPVHADLFYGALYVPVSINGEKTATLQVRLAVHSSTLSKGLIRRMRMPRMARKIITIDETGTRQPVRAGAIADMVRIDGIELHDVPFLNHVDKRKHPDYDYDGFLGQDVLSHYNVVVDRDKQVLWLAPRTMVASRDDLPARR